MGAVIKEKKVVPKSLLPAHPRGLFEVWCEMMLLIKAAPIVPLPCSVSLSSWLHRRLKEVDNIGDTVCVHVCHIPSPLRGWCVMPFHPAMATGSRERLHSCRSGAHRWEDEKLPTGPPTSQPQKPPWAHTSHFYLPRRGRRGLVCAMCCSFRTP